MERDLRIIERVTYLPRLLMTQSNVGRVQCMKKALPKLLLVTVTCCVF